MTTSSYPHIELREGIPFLEGTPMRVIDVVLDHLTHDRDGRELHKHHTHLSLGQIYCALAYYYDHHAELHRNAEDGLLRVKEMEFAEALAASPEESSYTTGDVAKICQVSPRTIVKWVEARRLRGYRGKRGVRRVLRSDLIRFLKEHGLVETLAKMDLSTPST